MELYNSFDDIDEQASIVVTNDIVTEVSQSFADMTEYSINELLNKTITKIFGTLRVGPHFNTENIDKQIDYFMFTKSLEARFVYIKVVKKIGRQTYVFQEKPNSRLEDKLLVTNKLLSDNHMGIGIYSSPDLTLIKANQSYLDVFDEPYNRKEVAIGSTLHKLVNWNDNNTWGRDLWENIIKSGEIFYGKEVKGLTGKWKSIYNDNTIIPITENGEVKLVISIFEDVTEKVLSRKKVEEQKKIIERQKELLEVEISDTKLLQSVSMELLCEDNIQMLYEKIIDAAMQIMHSQYASIQMVRPGHGNGDKLQLLAFRGFNLQAAKYWEIVDAEYIRTTCVEALRTGHRVIAPNVKECDFMQNTEDLDVYLQTGINSVQSTPLCSRNGRIIGVLSTHWREAHKPSERELRLLDVLARQAADLIEQRQAEEKLRESEEKLKRQNEQLQAIVDNIQESLFVFDKDGKYIIINKIAKERFSTSFDKIGDSYKIAEFYDLEGNEIPLDDHPNYRVKSGEVVKGKIVAFKLDGQKFYAIMSGIPIFDEKGNFLYGVISGRNITEFMKSQQTLRETQDKLLKAEREKNETLEKAMEMKDEFLSLISHEFRTPLNVINTAIQTLNFIYAEQMTDKVKEYMQTIKQNTNRQLRLVNNLLDITRANAGRIKINKKNIDIVFLTKAITESVYQYALHKGVSVTFVSTLAKKIIGIDDEKYERIILNLLSNAIKFTPEGKSIVVKLHSLKGNICVEVKDTGIGIPPNKLDVVFERFGQVDSSLSRQAEGTGIGLSLVKRFVEALDGSISVKSKAGKGTAFTILLPNETIVEEQNEKPMVDLMSDNRLVQTTHIEFSDIYL